MMGITTSGTTAELDGGGWDGVEVDSAAVIDCAGVGVVEEDA